MASSFDPGLFDSPPKTLQYFSHFLEKQENRAPDFVSLIHYFDMKFCLEAKSVSACLVGRLAREGGRVIESGAESCSSALPGQLISLIACCRPVAEKYETNTKSTLFAFLAWAAKENVSKRK